MKEINEAFGVDVNWSDKQNLYVKVKDGGWIVIKRCEEGVIVDMYMEGENAVEEGEIITSTYAFYHELKDMKNEFHPINDWVYCTNCDYEQIVKVGSDICLNCEKEGTLQWMDEIEQIEGEPQLIKKHT